MRKLAACCEGKSTVKSRTSNKHQSIRRIAFSFIVYFSKVMREHELCVFAIKLDLFWDLLKKKQFFGQWHCNLRPKFDSYLLRCCFHLTTYGYVISAAVRQIVFVIWWLGFNAYALILTSIFVLTRVSQLSLLPIGVTIEYQRTSVSVTALCMMGGTEWVSSISHSSLKSYRYLNYCNVGCRRSTFSSTMFHIVR